jgi:hypothetical protein
MVRYGKVESGEGADLAGVDGPDDSLHLAVDRVLRVVPEINLLLCH